MSMQNKKLYRVFWRVKAHTKLNVKDAYYDEEQAKNVAGVLMRYSKVFRAWIEESVPVPVSNK